MGLAVEGTVAYGEGSGCCWEGGGVLSRGSAATAAYVFCVDYRTITSSILRAQRGNGRGNKGGRGGAQGMTGRQTILTFSARLPAL
jgi:hypothetical protein